MGRTACTEPQWLYKRDLYVYLILNVHCHACTKSAGRVGIQGPFCLCDQYLLSLPAVGQRDYRAGAEWAALIRADRKWQTMVLR